MKIDLYTKIILTVIAIGVLVPALTNPPVTNKANAFVGNGGMISSGQQSQVVWQLKDNKVRVCALWNFAENKKPECSQWSN